METHADAEPDDADAGLLALALLLSLADPVDDAEADELTGSDLRDEERTRLSVDIVDIGGIHELNGVPISARSFVSM